MMSDKDQCRQCQTAHSQYGGCFRRSGPEHRTTRSIASPGRADGSQLFSIDHLVGYRAQSGRGKSSSALRCPISARVDIRLVYYLVSLMPCRRRRRSIGRQFQQMQSRLPSTRRWLPAVDEALMSAKANRLPAADIRSGRRFQMPSSLQPPLSESAVAHSFTSGTWGTASTGSTEASLWADVRVGS